MQATEAKSRRKEEKKNLRAQQKSALRASERGSGEDDINEKDGNNTDGEEGHFDGVATIGGPAKGPSRSTTGTTAAASGRGAPNAALASTSVTGSNGAPLLFNPDLPHLAAVLDKVDVVIHVLDARDPLAHRSSALEARVASKEGQKLLLVLNKIGACAPLFPNANSLLLSLFVLPARFAC